MKIKILDARGKFSVTSFGKVTVLFLGVVIIGAAVVSSVFFVNKQKDLDKQAKLEEQQVIEAAKADHKTYEDLYRAAYLLNNADTNSTVYLGKDRIPLYVGKDTVKEFLDRSGFEIDWSNSTYYYYEPDSAYNHERDEIITPAIFDDLSSYHLYAPGSGDFCVRVDDEAFGVIEIEFEAFDDCTMSDLDLDKCYIEAVDINFAEQKDFTFEYQDSVVDYTKESWVKAVGESNISSSSEDEGEGEIHDSVTFLLPNDIEVYRYYSYYEYESGSSYEYIDCKISHSARLRYGWKAFDNAFK